MSFERRRSPRITPSSGGEVRVLVSDRWHRAQISDMSTRGVRFAGDHLPSPGERVQLQLRVPCQLLRLNGAVLRRGSDDAVVELESLTRRQALAWNAALLESAPPTATRRGSVIVMVNDPDQQLSIGTALRDHGFEVIARTTPLDLLQRLHESRSPIRAAFVDGNLPNRAGLDVLEFLADEMPHIRRGLIVDRGEPTLTPVAVSELVLVDPHPDEVVQIVEQIQACS